MTEILLLDDDPLQLKLLARTLNSLGYTRVYGCTTAAAALGALRAPGRQIGLICLDLNMPDVDGVEFLRLLAERQANVPVILVSGEDERLLETAARVGTSQKIHVLGTLSKPVWPAELRGLLDKLQATPATGSGLPRAYTASEVARAIRSGELVNYYQPLVDMTSGRVIGMESLVRWRHPHDGLLLPERFIAVAEEHGLIRELSRIALRSALEDAKQWREAGSSLSVSVNISMDDLGQRDFPELVLGELERTNTRPTDLVLEVSEPRLSESPDAAMESLSRLRLKRVTMSIDEFGTGYSSLRQLRDLPFNEVKLDRSFLHGAGSNPILGAIFTASTEMAKRVGLRTVAVGVEDAGDWVWLRARNCHVAQGFFLGRPMPAAEVIRWLEEWDARRKEFFPG